MTRKDTRKDTRKGTREGTRVFPAHPRPTRPAPRPGAGRPVLGATLAAALLAACGGGSGTDSTADGAPGGAGAQRLAPREAVRLADQASFGATEALLADLQAQGAEAWVTAQLALRTSRYTSGADGAIHRHAGPGAYCDDRGPECLQEAASTAPLLTDFYRNALDQPDQLRQRVAFALQQIVVVSGRNLQGTYGFRNYYNDLLDNALGNYRDLLRRVALSPVMGDYLTFVNNDRDAPNENFGRELMQLFSIGTCALEPDGSLTSGHCIPTYTNETVRNYAFALTGWTYPAGGARRPGCAPAGLNCLSYDGDLVAAPAFHDPNARPLLSGRTVPAGSSPEQALEVVLDSLMAHPNIGPFIGRQLILHLVTSNPAPDYVARVAAAFDTGRHGSAGSGVKGDLAATVHAVLLDPAARTEGDPARAGQLREPALLFTGVLRGLGGHTDGGVLGPVWGEPMRQHLFRPTSVFNYYRPGYPVPGTDLEGPEFGIHGEGAAIARLNFLDSLLGTGADPAAATAVDPTAFLDAADDPAALVDRLAGIAIGAPLPEPARGRAIDAVAVHAPGGDAGDTWRADRVRTAAYLVYAAPDYQVHR